MNDNNRCKCYWRAISMWLQVMKRFCRLSDYLFPKVRNVPSPLFYKSKKGGCWVRGISLKWWWNERIFRPFFSLFVHFHVRLKRQEDEQCSSCYSFQLVDRGFSPEKQNSTCKIHWGEEMVWLHWVRLISWVYTWLSKEISLSTSADLARYHERGLEVLIS